ncbi:hypothetical protein [Neisseria yangbaofengii]|nr:hypothetical protein [Neisseria yangbaofengii]
MFALRMVWAVRQIAKEDTPSEKIADGVLDEMPPFFRWCSVTLQHGAG